MNELIYINEPNILFAYGQKCIDPRDGLTLFGPYEKMYGIRIGVIATTEGFRIFKNYLNLLQKPIFNVNSITRPMFPGFEAVFNGKMDNDNIIYKEISIEEIDNYISHSSNYKRTYDIVTLYLNKLIDANKNQDEHINLWFVIVPEKIYNYCRPMSKLPSYLVKNKQHLTKTQALNYKFEPSLFDEINYESKIKLDEAVSYNYDAQFHNQLKARLLKYTIPIQIIRESTLDWKNITNIFGKPLRDFSKIEGHLAWTLSTAIFYKSCGKPWILSDIRKGVCYLGLVYKKTDKSKNPSNACCAAQMFLDNGDGTVFKGELGDFYNTKSKEYHLDTVNAKSLLLQALKSYFEKNNCYPNEMFIHAKTRFNDEEWSAFQEVVPNGTNLVGVTIKRDEPLKLYRENSEYPILRGMAYIINSTKAYLWTIGFVPHIQTTLSTEVPNPLFIDINKGNASIEQVLKDIMALTKLNYNACIFGDGLPVTLRFANSIGEILTASTDIQVPPLAFKYYI
jgi:hypothetical protein